MATDDMELVREYAAGQSESAFVALVERHASLVHSAAQRQVHDPQLAEEITQAVFIILARKAASLPPRTVLPSRLYRTTRFAASNVLKQEVRRQRREQEAQMEAMAAQTESGQEWEQMSPLLDEAMAQLREQDRNALVLRYFQNKSLKEVGVEMGLEERAAQKRVARGLEKLRAIFTKRGIVLSAVAIAGAVSANSVQAAPAGLVVTVTAAAAKGTAVGGSTLALVKGALKLMAWAKAKTAIVVGVGALGLGAAIVGLLVETPRPSLSFLRTAWPLPTRRSPSLHQTR